MFMSQHEHAMTLMSVYQHEHASSYSNSLWLMTKERGPVWELMGVSLVGVSVTYPQANTCNNCMFNDCRS